MGFVVPSMQPAAPNYLNAPNAIRATSIDSILQLDRYCFATRRNVIASLSSVTTNYPRPNPMFVFDARTSKNSNGNVWVIAAGVDVRIEVSTTYSTVDIPLSGATIAGADMLTGIPADDWFTIEISIASGITPALATMRGLYLIEEILDAADLP